MEKSMTDSIEVLFERIENFVSTKTVVGEAIIIGDVTLLPLIDISLGMGAGGGKGKESQSGGGGLGAKITPSAVIAITNGGVQLINIKNQDAVSKLIDMAPGVVSKLNFGNILNKNPQKNESGEEVKFEEERIVEE